MNRLVISRGKVPCPYKVREEMSAGLCAMCSCFKGTDPAGAVILEGSRPVATAIVLCSWRPGPVEGLPVVEGQAHLLEVPR
jgi:hypothetical protein